MRGKALEEMPAAHVELVLGAQVGILEREAERPGYPALAWRGNPVASETAIGRARGATSTLGRGRYPGGSWPHPSTAGVFSTHRSGLIHRG